MEMAIDEELDHFAEACMVMLPELPTVSVSMEVDAAAADLSIGDQQQQQDGEEFVAFCDCEKLIGGGGLDPIDGSPPRLLHHDDHGPMTHNRRCRGASSSPGQRRTCTSTSTISTTTTCYSWPQWKRPV
ncbi:hypothetical protein PVAP13_5KG188307 [Panicum virgatum]|uniref:Uncharacterized protein n=1 Tax=Panicum virgatum TaxID=38727 RepID=A0A8T0SKS1_PANVG|nr:hypothetical protein PVAP13_5KG188307 [Panicum virgatum]